MVSWFEIPIPLENDYYQICFSLFSYSPLEFLACDIPKLAYKLSLKNTEHDHVENTNHLCNFDQELSWRGYSMKC